MIGFLLLFGVQKTVKLALQRKKTKKKKKEKSGKTHCQTGKAYSFLSLL